MGGRSTSPSPTGRAQYSPGRERPKAFDTSIRLVKATDSTLFVAWTIPAFNNQVVHTLYVRETNGAGTEYKPIAFLDPKEDGSKKTAKGAGEMSYIVTHLK